jgi:hypothetical protein
VLTLLLLAALWLLLSFAVAALMGQFRHLYARLTVAPGQTVWLEVKGNRLRFGRDPQDLEAAPWISATHVAFGPTRFGPTALPPLRADIRGEWGESQAYLSAVFSTCQVKWRLACADETGARWTYTAFTRLDTARSPSEAPANHIPRLARPTLEIHAQQQPEVQGEYRTIGVAVTMTDSAFDWLDITRDGRAPEVAVQTLDSDGKVLESKAGPLDLFGYT